MKLQFSYQDYETILSILKASVKHPQLAEEHRVHINALIADITGLLQVMRVEARI